MVVSAIMVFSGGVSSVLFLFTTIAALPVLPIKQLWEKIIKDKTWIKVLCIALFFVLGMAMMPSSDSSTPNTPTEPDNPNESTPTTEKTYVLNTNTKVFHYSSCSYANRISASNRGRFTGDRADLLKQGYAACKHCKP